MIDVIPAMDLIDGACVRLSQGKYETKKVYCADPTDLAKSFADQGIKRLHMVDLDGAKRGQPVNIAVLERVANATDLTIDYGGGVKSEAHVQSILDAGAGQISIGSMAVKDNRTVCSWLQKFGIETFILCADVRNGLIAVSGWQKDSSISLEKFITKYSQQGVKQFLCTSIDRDGMLNGTNVELYVSLLQKFPDLYLIASGGVASLDDIEELQKNGIPAVVVGKAFYEGRITLKEIGAYYA